MMYGAPASILGAPYIICPDMPSEGAGTFPIAFGDWSRAYTIVDRVSMSVLRDPYSQQTSGRIRFHARRRVGGQVTDAAAIRKLKCST
jgi:HK97 family phage major capsid protein